MSMTSYAQNFEDVLLWRALKSVATGRYVDVGAGHPQFHNVTKHFYDAGWSGINVEPLPALAAALADDRPRDVNVHGAITSRSTDSVELAVVDSWDELSTITGSRIEQLTAQGRALTTVKVPALRLDDLIARHAPGDIHFLKVDVEGAELEVLETIDLQVVRPWIVVIEVIAAGEENEFRTAIRTLVEGAQYVHAYFDGLNDFYVAAERAADLLPSFATPVNVTDDFVVAGASGDSTVLELVAEKVGLTSPVQPSEIIERVGALARDRIDFESELLGKVADLEQATAEVQALTLDNRSWHLRVDALEQTSFERERMVAWYAAEVEAHKARRLELVAQKEDASTSLAESSARLSDTQTRLHDVLSSTSWRVTMPLRAVRRPRLYLRKVLGR